jgi:integrase/recombinase XerC
MAQEGAALAGGTCAANGGKEDAEMTAAKISRNSYRSPAIQHAIITTKQPATVGINDLVATFLSGKSPVTVQAYQRDLIGFAGFIGVATIEEAARRLFQGEHGQANLLAMQYRAHLLSLKLSSATVNRRLTAIRSLVTLAKTLGLIGWSLEVGGVASKSYKDTRGPGLGGLRLLLKAAHDQRPEKSARDEAIVMLLFGLALRRAEVVSLDLSHWNQTAGNLEVLGKGHLDRVTMTVPAKVREALKAWLAVRGGEPGPLFGSMDRAGKGDGRLTGDGIFRLIRSLGRRVGLEVRPHGLRHAAITSALDITGGDVRSVARFSRHASIQTVLCYDDSRVDSAGRIAEQVAGLVAG